MIKGILIDPRQQLIVEATRDAGDYRTLYTLLSDEHVRVATFTMIHLSRREVMFLDEGGLLWQPTPPLFQLKGFDQPLAGRAVIEGVTPSGKPRDTRMTALEVSALITFRPDLELAAFRSSQKLWK